MSDKGAKLIESDSTKAVAYDPPCGGVIVPVMHKTDGVMHLWVSMIDGDTFATLAHRLMEILTDIKANGWVATWDEPFGVVHMVAEVPPDKMKPKQKKKGLLGQLQSLGDSVNVHDYWKYDSTATLHLLTAIIEMADSALEVKR